MPFVGKFPFTFAAKYDRWSCSSPAFTWNPPLAVWTLNTAGGCALPSPYNLKACSTASMHSSRLSKWRISADVRNNIFSEFMRLALLKNSLFRATDEDRSLRVAPSAFHHV